MRQKNWRDVYIIASNYKAPSILFNSSILKTSWLGHKNIFCLELKNNWSLLNTIGIWKLLHYLIIDPAGQCLTILETEKAFCGCVYAKIETLQTDFSVYITGEWRLFQLPPSFQ